MKRFFSAIIIAITGALLLAAPPAARAETASKIEAAVFAGGCFWCVEAAFDKVEGVISTTSGFSGGNAPNPTYKQVTRGGTGHAEVVRIEFDPAKVSYEKLLDVFWRNIDPFDAGGQFCDRGPEYRSEIFVLNAEQERLATFSKQKLMGEAGFNKPIATEITPFFAFYPAEEYHQDYHKKNPGHYYRYYNGCRRAERLAEIWGSKATH